MIDAPKPAMRWYVRLGSTLIVSSSEPPRSNSTVPCSASRWVPSGVVTQTLADGAATAGAAAAMADNVASASVRQIFIGGSSR